MSEIDALEGQELDRLVAFLEDVDPLACYSPSTRWKDGGPLIEREQICLVDVVQDEWSAVKYTAYGPVHATGHAPLIAAMRCYVKSKLGAVSRGDKRP